MKDEFGRWACDNLNLVGVELTKEDRDEDLATVRDVSLPYNITTAGDRKVEAVWLSGRANRIVRQIGTTS